MGKLKNFFKPISCKPCTNANDRFWGTAVKVANNTDPNLDSEQRKQIREISKTVRLGKKINVICPLIFAGLGLAVVFYFLKE